MIGLSLLVALVFVAADADTTVTMPTMTTTTAPPPTTHMPPVTTTMDHMTTTAPAPTTHMPAKVLYDMKHHKAMIVRADGCYEYHMNHQDVLDHDHDAARAVMEARMLDELSRAINIAEMGHHHIDHMSVEIRTACASVPIYSWSIA